MKVVHSWLQEYVGGTLPSPEEVESLLTFSAFEVEGVEVVAGEEVIDVDVLPNRSSDCLSHRGIARELATILKQPLANDPLQQTPELKVGSKAMVSIEDSALCARFTTAVITGVKVGPSPSWLKKRLEALGQRSINNVVDATNYVMFAIGQPTHAFDYNKLQKDAEGKVHIAVRSGKVGESLTLLTGEEIESNEDILHLADGVSGMLLDLAGIKGGTAAELTNETTDIVITSGNFNYQKVRTTSQRLKIHTDASQRFQNEPSPALALYGLAETVKLILDLAGGELDGMVEEYPQKPEPVQSVITTERTNSLLGITLDPKEIEEILQQINAGPTAIDGGFQVTSPWERTDLVLEEDYIEEIGRLYGLQKIESVLPAPQTVTEINTRHYYSEEIRRELTALGFSEVITSSFQKKGKLQLKNALASDKSYVRETLSKNLTSALDKNFSYVDLLGLRGVRLFEIGTVFYEKEGMVCEHVSLAFGVRTKGNGYSQKDDVFLKEAISRLEKFLVVDMSWEVKDGVAETNLTEVLEKLPVPDTYRKVEKTKDVQFKTISQFPAVARDIALWVGEDVHAETVLQVLEKNAGELCVRITLFDTFTKDGRTSYAFRLVFQSDSRTLTDAEVNTVMEDIYKAVAEQGWEVR